MSLRDVVVLLLMLGLVVMVTNVRQETESLLTSAHPVKKLYAEQEM